MPTPNAPLKSVRIDLSSLSYPSNPSAWVDRVLNRIQTAGGNAIYLSPWADGSSNYHSHIARQNSFGRAGVVETFIRKAHARKMRVFAWFVVGKDNFPAARHPEWYAKTVFGKPYRQEDEPGLFLPFASLASPGFQKYHLSLIREANQLAFDGWVISEPLVGWGDKYDATYTDFSGAAVSQFRRRTRVDPRDLFAPLSRHYYQRHPKLYRQWVSFRADTVTNFVRLTMNAVRTASPSRPIVVTLFTEPDSRGRLLTLRQVREWLGTDVSKIASLKPDAFEVQSLFSDFEYLQSAKWTASLVKQFRAQTGNRLPIMVSVQGFDGARKLTAKDFAAAMSAAKSQSVVGLSFYAYHTLSAAEWRALARVWK